MPATRDYVIRRPRQLAVTAKNCDRCARGWETFANEAMPVGARVARAVRDGNWVYAERHTTVAGALAAGVRLAGEIDDGADPAQRVTVFRFAGGQPCLSHPAPPRFFAGAREHARLGDWIEDLGEHAGRLGDQLRKG